MRVGSHNSLHGVFPKDRLGKGLSEKVLYPLGKEKILVLDRDLSAGATGSLKEKKNLPWFSFSAAAANTVLTRAVLLALGSAAAALLLRRYLLAPRRQSRSAEVRSSGQDEDSFDVLKD